MRRAHDYRPTKSLCAVGMLCVMAAGCDLGPPDNQIHPTSYKDSNVSTNAMTAEEISASKQALREAFAGQGEALAEACQGQRGSIGASCLEVRTIRTEIGQRVPAWNALDPQSDRFVELIARLDASQTVLASASDDAQLVSALESAKAPLGALTALLDSTGR